MIPKRVETKLVALMQEIQKVGYTGTREISEIKDGNRIVINMKLKAPKGPPSPKSIWIKDA